MLKKPTPTPLAGKAIVVTGGTTGIGRATAELLISDGARVLILGRHQEELDSALADMKEIAGASVGGSVCGLVADTTEHADVERIFAEADKQLGGVDVLVNNAAEAAQSIVDTEYDEWHYVVHANVLGYMDCSRHAIDRMKAKGGGHIVNIGSLSAKLRDGGADVYVATKAAIEGLSESLRKQVNEMGIKVSLVEPGKVGADFPNSKPEEQPAEQAAGKMLMSEDIAAAVHFCLTQPERSDVILLQIRPRHQSI